MAIQFIQASEIKTGYTSWFFYGKSRTGKTEAASTFPRPLFIQPTLEASHETLQGKPHVDIIFTRLMEQTEEILTDLEARAAKAQPLWDKGDDESLVKAEAHFPWQTIVFESLTHYCDDVIEQLTKGGRIDMDQQKWGKLTAHLRNIHSRLKSLPVHIIYVSLVTETFDRKGELVASDFAFQGSMSMRLPSACSSVVYFDRREGKGGDLFMAHLTKYKVYTAGSRLQGLKGVSQLTPFRWSEVAKHLGW